MRTELSGGQAPAGKLPPVLAREAAPERIRLELAVPATLAWFAGHFPDHPVLPGVAQVGWAVGFAREHFGFADDPPRIERVKFENPVRPGDEVSLELSRNPRRPAQVDWRLGRDELVLSVGRLEFADPVNPCALIPVYNHHQELPRLVAELAALGLPVLLVDDGSDEPARSVLERLAAENPQGLVLVRRERNEGKGAAVLAGLAAAGERGYTHAVQLDADGQHDAREADSLLALARERPDALVSGVPDYDESVPAVRYYGRWLTHLLVWVETLSREITDSMCGFRVYPIGATLALAHSRRLGRRMDFDTEVMVRLYFAGVPVRFRPVSVRYPAGGVSHFRLFRDNLRMTWLHLRLLAGLPLRLLGRAPR